MGHAPAAADQPPHRLVRDRRPPRGRGDGHAGPVPVARVVVYHAAGCHLCERALEVVREACGDGFDLVDIGGDTALEERYRERIPLVEIDGEEAFTYFVDAAALRRRLGS